jgi:predicted CXXCH cytochrome family protein
MMRQASSCSVALLFFALFLCAPGCAGITAPAPKAEAFRLPPIKQDCTTCHVSLQKEQGAPLLKKPLEELCSECHPERTAPTEHKVGIIPSMKVGALPLADNRLTCITCHDPHSNRFGRMLRVPAKDLCQSCHLK